MKIHVLHTGVLKVNTLVVPTMDGKCFIVDPADCGLAGDENLILDYLKSQKLECEGIVLTHSHFDHITGIATLKDAFPKAKIALHEVELAELSGTGSIGPMNDSVTRFFGVGELRSLIANQPAADTPLKDGMSIFGWKVIHTPGHTPGSVCLYKADAGEEGQGVLISGDTLFAYGGYGRTDMYGGDEAEMQKSLARLHGEIPAGTLVYPGHDSFGFEL